jgi:hypothetical protein
LEEVRIVIAGTGTHPLSQQQRDEDKQLFLMKQEVPISLVPISYQWNGTWSHLKSKIKSVCY